MTFERPPRLKHDEEFGDLLRAADDIGVTPERLAENAARYKALIATGATTALWKLLVPLVLVLALVPIAYRATRPATPPSITNASPEHALTGEAPAMHASVTAPEEAVAAPAEEPPKPRPVVIVKPPAPVVALPAPPAVPAPSELPEQIRLYEEARDAGARRDYATGVQRIDDLLARFPATPLRAEAELTRAEYLARANRVDEAVRALEALIGNATHRSRHGELLRTLGDLYRRSGDCTRALAAYDRALAMRLRDRDRKEVIAGRARCAKQ